jgi:4-amino-4-deoxy-L-arabinose transferase-like glycosyltransferase
MPAYPLFLALTTLAGKSYLWIAVPQALMGAGTVLCAYLIGGELFGKVTGLLAGSITALYPYYIVHDTALQETGLFTFLTALAVFALLRAKRSGSWMVWASAGICLGAAVLTRQTLAPFAVVAIVWIGIQSGQPRFRRCGIVALAFAWTAGPWVVRNALVIGSPVLTSEGGRQLWNANNTKTFSHYPDESIDRSADEAFDAFTVEDRRELDSLGGNEIDESRWFQRKGIAYIEAHPGATLRAAGRKLQAAFSWRFNPVREPLVQTVYLLSYMPILMLGVIGMVLSWRRWKELSVIYLLFLTFAAVTAVFFAHTSHRSYLDVYLIVFSAHAIHQAVSRTIPSRWY